MAEKRSIHLPRVSPGHALALMIAELLLLLAIFGPLLAPYDPTSTNPPMALKPPSAEHLVRHRPARP